MRFQLLIGKPVAPDRALPAAASDSSALRRQAADALVAYYERDETTIWPKGRFRAGAPEIVRILGEYDEVLAQYTILDYAAETGCVFVHRKQAGARPERGVAKVRS
jgi:hypothetical protein